MKELPVALFATACMAGLWLVALGELARQPVTHTGTQSAITRPAY